MILLCVRLRQGSKSFDATVQNMDPQPHRISTKRKKKKKQKAPLGDIEPEHIWSPSPKLIKTRKEAYPVTKPRPTEYEDQ